MNDNWLQLYLVESVHRNLCTQIGCTTCVSHEFRLGVVNTWAMTTGRPAQRSFDQESIDGIATALAGVHPTSVESSKFEDAVRCLLSDLWTGIPILDKRVEALLNGTWSGNLLQEMQEHDRARRADRRTLEEYNNPANVQKRREEKKRLKQEEHQQRLALKKDRDRAWREKHGGDSA